MGLTVHACLTAPTRAVERAVIEDFETMAAVVVADALFPTRMRVTTARWLRSREGHLHWLDGLLCARGQTIVALDRQRYARAFDRVKALGEQLQALEAAVRQAEALRRHFDQAEFLDSEDLRNSLDPDYVAANWLRQYLSEEYRSAVYLPLLIEHGLDPDESFPSARDAYHQIALAVETGLLYAPLDQVVQELLNADDRAFRMSVLADCREQSDRNTTLRHPLLLERWRQTLTLLVEETAPRALNSSRRRIVPVDGVLLKPLSRGQAEKVFRSRDLLYRLMQRATEEEHLRRRLSRDVHSLEKEYARPRAELGRAATRIFAQQHPQEFAYIRRRVISELGRGDGMLRYDRKSLKSERGVAKRRIFAELDAGAAAQ